MKQYKVKYDLGKMYHSYVIEAKNEAEAIREALSQIPCPEIMHDFSIEKYVPEWN